ncbi:MAG: AAA family ATPase [Allorhizobium sp.]
MPVITFANTKGGAGKTTAVLLLATELERMGFNVTVLDADPQFWITRWRENSGDKTKIKVVPYVTLASLEKHIQESRRDADYVLLDLPGARTPLLAKAIGYSNHVLIPIQGCSMDAQGGAHVIELMQYLADKGNIHIPFSVVLTRVNSMVTTRALQTVKALLAERGVNVLGTPIIERSAFRDVFDFGGTLHTLAAGRVSNLEKARENARAFAEEVLMHEALRCRRLQLEKAGALRAVA